jgi:RNA 2',3'-cyclic 3'-phosphodiesterase
VNGITRAFVAVSPPPDVLDAVDAALAPLRDAEPRLRWLPRDQWHVTIEFLGRVEDVEPLVDGLARVARGLGPLEARLAGAGAFPKPRRASVVWVGVESDGLTPVADAVGEVTTSIGHVRDARPFHPHVTVARASRPRAVDDVIESLGAALLGPPWVVDALVLYESATLPTGAVHTEVARFELSA